MIKIVCNVLLVIVVGGCLALLLAAVVKSGNNRAATYVPWQVVTIDGCQYIQHNSQAFLVHKANCPNH